MPHRDLNMLDAADRASDRVTAIVDRSSRPMLHSRQLIESAQAISANISEGFGRGSERDRARMLRIARGEAEETIRHLNKNFRSKRISAKDYWPIHNLLVVIVKMLNAFLNRA
ncbi:MAG TPA: four helix bundle protein [Gemmatimonadaceae bacterium]